MNPVYDLGECNCCGKAVLGDKKQYTTYDPDESVYCDECGGDPTETLPLDQFQSLAETYNEYGLTASIARKQGWASVTFFGARIEILAAKLSDENRVKFLGHPWPKKCNIIGRMIEKGAMI